MKYMGSKARHADEFLKIVLAKREPGQTYVEPFIGGANVMCRVPAAGGPRIGADVNGYMIALHRALAAGWHPPETMSEEQYNDIKDNQNKYPPELVGFVGTSCSFGSGWFSSFTTETSIGSVSASRARAEKEDIGRCAQAARSCLRDAPGLVGVELIHSSYDQLKIPPRSLVYCDPPYVGTTGYEGADQSIQIGESSDKNTWRAYKFWRWVDRLVDEGHTVFVSEYEGPTATAFPPVIPPEVKAEIKRLADIGTAKQRDSTCPREEVQAAVDAWIAAQANAAATGKSRKDEWKIVWEKETSVTIAAYTVDVVARKKLEDELRRTEQQSPRAAELRRVIEAMSCESKVERLFHRSLASDRQVA